MGPDGGGPRPIDENLHEGQDFVLTRSGDVVLAPRRLRWTVDEVLLNVNRMEEEPGENLIDNRIGEEINSRDSAKNERMERTLGERKVGGGEDCSPCP